MKSNLLWTAPALALVLILPDIASAQVEVRVPFVRVRLDGPGVSVRAPFVNIFVPSSPRVVAPAETFVPPPPRLEETPRTAKPAPQPEAPPANVAEPPLTLEQFAKAFQPKAGSYEVIILNPVTRQPTAVRFTLPEGAPRRVNTSRREIEFDYGPRRYVRIQFDREGVEVTTR